MANETTRPLKVFLCHASGDKPAVRDLYKRLIVEGVDAWLDQEKLLPGQDWRVEIPRAVREADVVVICLSNKSITKEGYVQREIKFALDSAEEKPEDTIFLIPARLEDCVVPEQLGRWQWVDLFDENGFIRLLRSLKLRADRVGATIEPLGYENEDQETELRLEQLYTEGLAAFYTEDWDRAYQRFQSILRERPNHRNAAEKLAQAERRKILAKLYTQAAEALQSENWQAAIQTLEELLGKSGDYKDSAQLLADAKKQHRLKELYAEAKRLHNAQKWQAVVKVFEQISIIEPAYPDPDGLLTSSQKEAAELKRLTDLNELYSQGIHKMDAGEWYEARSLLEQVHKAQTGFLDTERLLRKVENEIIRIEELNKRNNQINTLYEQAHGLIRSKSWRMALDKMEEIQRLDNQFVDKDGLFEKAKIELEQENQAAQRQNELAAMYAEATRLLKEGKYQEALEKWQEVRSIDSKYPDRQRVQSIASRKLTELGKPIRNKPRLIITKPIWAGLIALVAMGVLAGVILASRGNEQTPPAPTATSSEGIIAIPSTTTIPTRTSTPQPAIPLPTEGKERFRIQIRILTSSDWTQMRLISGGQLENVKILSSSPQATDATLDGPKLILAQPLLRAGTNTVEMIAEAMLTNTKSGVPLVLEVIRGNIGETTIEVSNALVQPILVQTLSWNGCCDALNPHQFEVPVELFMISSPPETAYRWDFGNGRQAWGGFGDITFPTLKDGYLTFTSTGDDPRIFSPNSLQISAFNTPIISIRMRIVDAQNSQGAIYFVTSKDIYWNGEKQVDFDIIADGTFHTYDILMLAKSTWRDVITQFRLDPTWVANAQIAIDYISVHAPY